MKLLDDKIIYHRHFKNISTFVLNPDEIVLNIVEDETSETPKMIDDKFVIHSTSWRYENDEIILTYIAYSDQIDFLHHPTKVLEDADFLIAKSVDSKRPRPLEIKEVNVVSHAIRHLGFLIRTDEKEKYMKAISRNNVKFLEKTYTTLAGELS